MSAVHQGDRRCRRCYECAVCSRNVTQDMAQHDEMLGATGLRPGEIALHLTKRKRWF